MKIVIKMLSTAEMRRRHKVAENGPVQAAIDSECMRYMSDYMPRRQAGELKHLMVAATTIGSGQIIRMISFRRRRQCLAEEAGYDDH